MCVCVQFSLSIFLSEKQTCLKNCSVQRFSVYKGLRAFIYVRKNIFVQSIGMQTFSSLCKKILCVKVSVCKSISEHKPLCVRIPARKSYCMSRFLCAPLSGSRYVLVQNASPKEIQVQMFDVLSVVADNDDARRAPQGVILVVLNQFVKAFGTSYFLRVITTKRHFFWYIFCSPIWHSYFISYIVWHFFCFFLAVYRVNFQRSFVVEVRRATLWSGGDHSDPQVAVRARQGNTAI